uniref:Uncharacterized protein n=1 Tax=Thermosporothrix sp. COM3 TaxID=2490863 RepID=A0A455SKB4_9CHLR|nr:hypothetical protein KTC_13460 [Thermosporothrix sp. COM3]
MVRYLASQAALQFRQCSHIIEYVILFAKWRSFSDNIWRHPCQMGTRMPAFLDVPEKKKGAPTEPRLLIKLF